MTRKELIVVLEPAIARVEGIDLTTAERVCQEKTTNELSILYSKYLNDGHFQPSAPAVTDADVEAARLKGEAELANLREQHSEALSRVRGEREADRLEFRRQQDEAAIPERREAILRARQTITDAQSVLRSFTLNEAVFNLIIRELGVDVTAWAIRQALDSNVISLPAPTEQDRQAWAEQDIRNENRRLLDLSVPELKAEIKREAAQRQQQVEKAEAERVQKLQEQTDGYLGYPPLPERNEKGEKLDSLFFRRASAAVIKNYARRFGVANLNKAIMERR